MKENLQEHIEKFLDEFMQIEYKGKDHIIARKHYREVFYELIPKYFITTPVNDSNNTKLTKE